MMQLWRSPEPKEAPFFSAASSPVGEGRFVITHPGNYGPLTAFDVTSGKVARVTGGDTLFGFSRRASGQLFALDARDGRVLWLGEPRFATNVAFAKVDDLLFVLKDDAELTIARANSSRFEPLKTYEVAEGATWAQPVVSGQRLFVKDVSTLTLWAFD